MPWPEPQDHMKSFQIGNTSIKCDDNVTLLLDNIDYMLKFDNHVTNIFRKAFKQLAVLKRLGRFLTNQGKLVIYNSFIAVLQVPVNLKNKYERGP